MKNKSVVILTLLIGLVSLPFQVKAANDVTVKTSLDSAFLLMGKQTTLHVEIKQKSPDLSGYLIIPSDTLSKEIEIVSIGIPDTTEYLPDAGARFIHQDIVLQSFDSGLYPVGPIAFVAGNGDTVFSNPLSLKVIPVNVDSLDTIHSFAPVVKANSRWWDFVPDILLDYWLYFIIVLLIIIGGIVSWLVFKKKVSLPFIPREKPIPPYLQALNDLDNLKDKHLCEKGMEKEFYTDLTDILRKYLEARFDINAMEMTSSQILGVLKKHPDIHQHHDMVKRILEIADFVKFAKVRPLPSDNVTSWNNAREFVIDTKPVEDTQENDNSVKESNELSDPKKSQNQ